MSPTVFKLNGYRFFFFSREERRPHVHVSCADGEAKFWLDPIVELVKSHGLSQMQIGEMRKIVEERQNELARAWISHFRS
jgi:hypothetical protein